MRHTHEGHIKELLWNSHGFTNIVHGMVIDAALKLFAINQINDLYEKDVHHSSLIENGPDANLPVRSNA